MKVKSLITKLISAKFLRFFISGITSFAVDTIILSIVTLLIFQGSNPILLGTISVAKLISSTFGLATNFILNRNWVFNVQGNTKLKAQTTKFIIFSLINVLFASIIYNIYLGIIIFLSSKIGIEKENNLKILIIFTNFITEGTKMIISFVGYKYFVFK